MRNNSLLTYLDLVIKQLDEQVKQGPAQRQETPEEFQAKAPAWTDLIPEGCGQ